MTHHTTGRRWDRKPLREPELPLFSSAANGTDSSQAGAKKIAFHRECQYRRVLQFVKSQGEHGATNEEVQLALDMKSNAETRAMNDLQRLGLARDSGRRRRSSAGVNVIVWIAT